MTNQLDLFAADPAPPRAPARPDTALLLAMSADHTTTRAESPPPAAAPQLPRTGAELVAQARGCCGQCEATGHALNYTWHEAAQSLLCQRCHADALGYIAQPNENGVYCDPGETLALPRPVKGWEGSNLAEIDLINLGPHWLWSTSYELHSGDMRGSSSPLSDHPRNRAPSRTAAIDAAKSKLRSQLDGVENPDARRIIAWLDELGQGALL